MKSPGRFLVCLAAAIISLTSVSCAQKGVNYVSPDGNDADAGTRTRPWKTLSHAIKASIETRGEGDYPIKIIMKGGEYPVSETIVVAGVKDLAIVAAKGETPVLSGDVFLSGWEKVDDQAVLARLPESSRGKVWQADLDRNGIDGSFQITGGENRIDLYFNGKRFHPARWPNDTDTKSGKALGSTPTGPNYANYKGSVEGIFEYLDGRIDNWAAEKEAYLHGYWFWDWSEDCRKVESIDTEKHVIKLEAPWHQYGYRDSFRFYGMNLLCELDVPGEYWLDRDARKVYLFEPEGFDPDGKQVSVSLFNGSTILQADDSRNLTVSGITFRGGRNGAIGLNGGSGIEISDCRVEQFGNDALLLLYGKDYHISGCLFQELGHGVIFAKGGNRKTLENSGYEVVNNIFTDFSLYKPTYEPAIVFYGCGLEIGHNHFQNCPSSALRLEGNDIIVEKNRFVSLVTESDDQGAVDVYYNPSYRGNIVRWNWWQDIVGGTREGAAAVRLDDMISGFNVYGNVFVNCGGGGFGAVQIHGGKDNIVQNNLMYDCLITVHATRWGQERFTQSYYNDVIQAKLKEVDFPSPLYKQRYPELDTDEDMDAHADRNFLKDNLSVNPRKKLQDLPEYVIENTSEITSDKTLDHFLNEGTLKEYGLSPIPWQDMGLGNNRYAKLVELK